MNEGDHVTEIANEIARDVIPEAVLETKNADEVEIVMSILTSKKLRGHRGIGNQEETVTRIGNAIGIVNVREDRKVHQNENETGNAEKKNEKERDESVKIDLIETEISTMTSKTFESRKNPQMVRIISCLII